MDTFRPIGVSTAWNAVKHSSGRAIVQELLDLGFSCLELSNQITTEMLEDIEALVREERVTISCLHNYCPAPTTKNGKLASQRLLLLSSPDPAARNTAIRHTKLTIDWAARLGAPVVVMNLGDVPVLHEQKKIFELLATGHHEEAHRTIQQHLMERAMERGPYVESLIISMKELANYATDTGVKLGCKNRHHYTEVPTIDELMMVFKHVGSRALGYWHDTGHAHMMELMGIATQEDFLKRYSDRLIGMHIHDAKDNHEHRALGHGDIDFTRIAPYIKPDTHLILDIHGDASPEDMLKSRDTFVNILQSIETSPQV